MMEFIAGFFVGALYMVVMFLGSFKDVGAVDGNDQH